MRNNNTITRWDSYILPMIIIAVMFSVLGFAVGINAFFVPYVKAAFKINTAMSYLVTTATFSAFVIFGLPSAKILKKEGYKRSIFIAFILMAAGMLLIVPAAKLISFSIFLIALFVNGTGQALLNAAVNPYVTILGPEESAAKRISIMGICNKLSFGFAPVILAVFMDTISIQLNDAIVPFFAITLILVLLGILLFFAPLPEVQAVGEAEGIVDETSLYANSKRHLFQFPHLILGGIAIFLYVGVENAILTSINDYAIELNIRSPERFAVYTSVGYVIGYLLGILLIPKMISQRNAMIVCSVLGTGLTFFVTQLNGSFGIYLLAALGFANSLIWPAIWPLALSSLGKFTKSGASFLVMGIAGGGVIPPMLGLLRDSFESYQHAYWLLMVIYVYFLFFALKGYRLR